jgi:hypothetical protein
VMAVCTKIAVLDFGRLIFTGSPADVANSPVVRAAYLGAEAVGLEEVEPATIGALEGRTV